MKRVKRKSNFWTALWEGLASPVTIYAPPAPYRLYLSNDSVADSFTRVGISLSKLYGIDYNL